MNICQVSLYYDIYLQAEYLYLYKVYTRNLTKHLVGHEY